PAKNALAKMRARITKISLKTMIDGHVPPRWSARKRSGPARCRDRLATPTELRLACLFVRLRGEDAEVAGAFFVTAAVENRDRPLQIDRDDPSSVGHHLEVAAKLRPHPEPGTRNLLGHGHGG